MADCLDKAVTTEAVINKDIDSNDHEVCDSVDQWLYRLANIDVESILNDDVLINILNMLNPKELFQLQRVSKQFQYCCQQSLKKVKVLRIRSQLMTDDECYTRNTLDINGLKIHFIEIHWLADKLPNIEVLVISPELSLKTITRFAKNCPQIESLCFGPKFADTLTDNKLMAIMDLFGDRLNRFRLYSPDDCSKLISDYNFDYNSVDPMITDILFAVMFEVFESLDNPYRRQVDPVFPKVGPIDESYNKWLNMYESELSESDYQLDLINHMAMKEIHRRFVNYCGSGIKLLRTSSRGQMYSFFPGLMNVIKFRLGDLNQVWSYYLNSDIFDN